MRVGVRRGGMSWLVIMCVTPSSYLTRTVLTLICADRGGQALAAFDSAPLSVSCSILSLRDVWSSSGWIRLLRVP